MPTLQEELNRFRDARYGADVKDAFISCINKIHAENETVISLEEEIASTAAEVSDNKDEILTAVDEAQSEAASLYIIIYPYGNIYQHNSRKNQLDYYIDRKIRAKIRLSECAAE